MKTLADLKREAKSYTWELVHNSWFPQGVGARLAGMRREVSILQTNSLAFKTPKPEGGFSNSWLMWPKASEIVFADTFTKTDGTSINADNGGKLLIITQGDIGDKPAHIMVYHLRPI